MLDINEIRKRAQQASEKATDAMKKTFEKSEELIDKLEVADLEQEESISAAKVEEQLNANTDRQVEILGQIFGTGDPQGKSDGCHGRGGFKSGLHQIHVIQPGNEERGRQHQ